MVVHKNYFCINAIYLDVLGILYIGNIKIVSVNILSLDSIFFSAENSFVFIYS